MKDKKMRANRRWKEFDSAIDTLSRSALQPPVIVDAIIYVADTLEKCAQASEAVFGDESTPELALAIYDRVNIERIRLVDEHNARKKLDDHEE